MKIWEGVDASEAEARLANLRRRQAKLEEVFEHQQQIERLHPSSFAVELSRRSLESRRILLADELTSILKYRLNEPLKLTLSGKEFHDHSASIGTLGLFLLRLQKLYSAVAQAVQTGPTLRGPIATALRQATEMRLSYVYESSFGMELYVPSKLDLVGDSVASESLNRLFQLLAASDSEKRLMAASGALGGRVTNHLRYMASYLATSDSTIELAWSDYTGREHTWIASPSLMQGVVQHLKQITQTSSKARTFTGTLVGGSIFKNNFELLNKENGSLIEGSMVSGLAAAMTRNFGRVCTVIVDETELLDKGSGERRSYYVLTAIKDDGVQLPAALE